MVNLSLLSQASSFGSSSTHVCMLKQINVMLHCAVQDMLPEFLEQLTLRDNPWTVIALYFVPSVLVLISNICSKSCCFVLSESGIMCIDVPLITANYVPRLHHLQEQ